MIKGTINPIIGKMVPIIGRGVPNNKLRCRKVLYPRWV
jgi:hypothetical protein